MKQRYDFVGTYIGQSRQFTKGQITFVLCDRDKPTKNKPKQFLLFIISPSKKRHYFSSLYPMDGYFRADYQGTSFKVKLGGQTGGYFIQVSEDKE